LQSALADWINEINLIVALATLEELV